MTVPVAIVLAAAIHMSGLRREMRETAIGVHGGQAYS
jgi:hypothetical protein